MWLGALFSSECCQWSKVGFCCFLSADSRSKSQPGGNTACSFWTSLTIVWHQPSGRTEAGPQDTPRSVWASVLLRTAHSSTVISQGRCQFKILGKQCNKKNQLFHQRCSVERAVYNRSQCRLRKSCIRKMAIQVPRCLLLNSSLFE